MRERLSALPVSELREIAKANGIKSVTTLRKQQLIDMIIETAERKDAESNSVEKSGEEAIKVSKKEISKDETVENFSAVFFLQDLQVIGLETLLK